jgi:SAM-dependent methyltransferase
VQTEELDLSKYDTDKINHHYLDLYAPMLAPWRDKPVRLLEIGILKGGSLRLWKDYFPQGIIAGIDLTLPADFAPAERIHLFEGSQTDLPFLARVANSVAPEGFDIIIDDASHMGAETKASFWHLIDKHLKPGGLYVIEDWGTGYWDDWPDGRSLDPATYVVSSSRPPALWDRIAVKLHLRKAPEPSRKDPFPNHSHGMVGFIKQLVDEQGASDASRRNLSGTVQRGSRFQSMLIMPSVVFIRKHY